MSTKWKIKEVETGKEIELTDVLELIIIELPKARRILEKDSENKLAQWMLFLNNPNELEVLKMVEKNEDIKVAMEELEEISEDKKLRRLAELREKAIRDEKNGLIHAREEGLEEGIKEGIKKGIEKVIRNMLNKKIDIQTITELTGVAKEEIEKMHNKI